jgi:threonine synthase
MKYLSTRGGAEPRTFTEILLEGLMPDGGLAVPDQVPRFMPVKLAALRDLPYPQLALEIIRLFVDDIPAQDLKAILEKTYTQDVFGTAEITPVKTLEPGLHILACSNGPTLAFKDIAMQFLGHLFEYVLAKKGKELNILGATSGDTGSSAEYAMKGRAGVRVFMLSPHERMSPFQTAQMFSLDEPNIFNIAVRGVFDDCQDMVKAVSADAQFKSRYHIGAVNSINWARVVAQVVYYFKGYFAVSRSNEEQVDFVVPSGNFGNIYAGYLARKMGLPIRRLILATNENDVLHEFFETGAYRPRKAAETFATSSPSMDISKASNFERYIWDICGGGAEGGAQRAGDRVAALWREIEHFGGFDLSEDEEWAEVRASGFVSGSSSHAARVNTIKSVHEKYGVVIDPHTADGVSVGRQLRAVDEDDGDIPMICLETALPAKFEATVVEALGKKPERPPGFENIEQLPQSFSVMDADAEEVKAYIADVVASAPAVTS